MTYCLTEGCVAAQVLEHLRTNPGVRYSSRDLANIVGTSVSTVSGAMSRAIELGAVSAHDGPDCRVLSAGPNINTVKIVPRSQVHRTVVRAADPAYKFADLLAVWGIRRPDSLKDFKWVRPWQVEEVA